jgi:hypothetical protein
METIYATATTAAPESLPAATTLTTSTVTTSTLTTSTVTTSNTTLTRSDTNMAEATVPTADATLEGQVHLDGKLLSGPAIRDLDGELLSSAAVGDIHSDSAVVQKYRKSFLKKGNSFLFHL